MVYKGKFIPRKRVSLGDKTEKNGARYFGGEELNEILTVANGITGVNNDTNVKNVHKARNFVKNMLEFWCFTDKFIICVAIYSCYSIRLFRFFVQFLTPKKYQAPFFSVLSPKETLFRGINFPL